MEPTAVGPSADAEPRRPRISALRRAVLRVGAGLGAALLVGALVPVWPALRLSVDGDRLGHLPLAEGEQFTVSYVHSIDHLPIEENLEVRDGELVADSTRLRQFGAGMGQIPGQGTGRADGEWWVIEDMNRHVGPELAIRVGTASVDHRLRTPDAEVRLSPCLTSRRVAVEPARISTLVLLVGRSPQPVCDE
ncbi:DUF1850 domain-containing protein [Nocardiopsis sp. L17-MgMaSL7]|uniref:DUF1850 domain-containing protein n=1 Tax=Nocardiopsis sp. L17-MgMaSL7 TaxID=1938893 RepID=UPI000D70D499|nr:DUF1850 domain-containing protein [Nocardiopsis sp. L17-MgMaSL7]PWV52105.1 hypothetical protein BDW27_10620 [Nocardiopsis sp. L17-MgMaSL7]